ncbi:MAG TPA: hypothetical protein VEY88_22335, partial [Archangium sp.]|nr:hypothetical protein [Archangium sp.]
LRDHYDGRLVLTNDQPVLIAGGMLGEESIEQFNFAQQQWSIVGQLSIRRQHFTVDVLTGGSVLIAGGSQINTYEPYATMDLFTPDTTCTPVTCSSQGAQCGAISDGCGGTLQCGTCGSGYTCSSANACVPGTPAPPAGSLTYSATNTNSAQQSTTNRTFTLNAGDTLEVGTCGLTGATASGDTFLRVFGVGGTEVAYNDDSCGSYASFIRYTVSTSGTYEVRAGCYSSESCEGTVVWRVNVAPPVTTGSFTYSASNTRSGSRGTVDHSVKMTEGQTLQLGTCTVAGSSGSGDTYLRLVNAAGTEVGANDNACGSLSYLSYTVPAGAGGTYTIRAGCASNRSCGGTVAYTFQ